MGYFMMYALGIIMGIIWTFVPVDAETLNKINDACVSNAGIEKAIIEVGRIRVYCKDGAEFRLKD